MSRARDVFTPPEVPGEMSTLAGLRRWMARTGANFHSYEVGRPPADGFWLRKGPDGAVEMLYFERGRNRPERRFETEAEAVAAFATQVAADPWAWTHCVRMTADEAAAAAAMATLETLAIPAVMDRIPYGGPDDPRWRVFVFGTDRDRALAALGPAP